MTMQPPCASPTILPPSFAAASTASTASPLVSGTYVSSRIAVAGSAPPWSRRTMSRRRDVRSRMTIFRSGGGSGGGGEEAEQARRHGLGQRPGRALGADARRATRCARTAVDQVACLRDELLVHRIERLAEPDAAGIVVV